MIYVKGLLGFLKLFLFVRFILCEICVVKNNKANCADRQLEKVPQDLPRSITFLDLKGNYLQMLSNNSFFRYRNLTELRLERSRLSFLDSRTFFGLSHLNKLNMSSNDLNLSAAYSKYVFQPLISLTILDIRQNLKADWTVPISYPYFGHLHNLKELLVDLATKPVFESSGFENLRSLVKIVFDQCYLRAMLNNTFLHMPDSLEELEFHKCKITGPTETNFLGHLMNLKELTLNRICTPLESALKILYPFMNKTMRKIDFTKVNPGCRGPIRIPKAVILTQKMMQYLQQICMKIFILAENGIVDFEPNSLLTYKYPHCFEIIIFSRNRFSIIDGFKSLELIALCRLLGNLKEFDLSFNPISYNKADTEFENRFRTSSLMTNHETNRNKDYLTRVTNLNRPLASNSSKNTRLYDPKAEIFQLFLPPNLTTIRISHFMQKENIKNDLTFNIDQNSTNLRYVDLSYLHFETFPKLNFTYESEINFIDLSGTDSILFSSKINMPLFKNIKTVHLRNTRLGRTMYLRGSAIFKLIPAVRKLDISSNNMWFFPSSSFYSNRNLSTLIMNNNLLTEFPLALTVLKDLCVIDLKYDMIQTINKTMRDWLDRQQKRVSKDCVLHITRNPFKCSCENKGFILWLFSTKVIFDNKNKTYKCTLDNGSVTNTLVAFRNFHQIFSNCESETWLRVGIILLSTFILMVIPVGIIINFRWRIMYWIFRKFQAVVENKIKATFEYDVYLSYGTDSLSWVKNTLMRKIENSWNMKVCIEDRDFLGGDICSDAIIKSLQQSRNVIFIISGEFGKKTWGNFEIQRAKYEKFTGYLRRIIVIGKNVEVEEIPQEIGAIWEDVTFIKWTDEDQESCWEQLRAVLKSI